MPQRVPLEPGCFYHIYNHANGNENLFLEAENYFFFLRKYASFLEESIETLAYCLLPNHFHLLVRISTLQLPESLELSGSSRSTAVTAFKRFFSSYTQSFNKQQNRKGSLFIPNFKRKKIDSDDYLTKIIHYIHYNPVHHGFSKDLDQWPYSSYQSLISDKPTLLRRREVLDWFGGKKEFIEFHKWKPDDRWSHLLE